MARISRAGELANGGLSDLPEPRLLARLGPHSIRHLALDHQYLRYPAWSPRGDRVVFERAETTGDIWTLHLEWM